MVFHQKHKQFEAPNIRIKNTILERVETFNFLRITIDQQLSWKPHLNNIASKITRTIGVLNRLKHFLPMHIKRILYISLILPNLNYGILVWGFHCQKLVKLQKRAVRVVYSAKYNAHTDPIFKELNLLKIQDIFHIMKLKFYHKFINKNLPENLLCLPFNVRENTRNYSLRSDNKLTLNRVNHAFAKNTLSFSIPYTINQLEENVFSKLFTHSLNGLAYYVKQLIIKNYQTDCSIIGCYICQNSQAT